MHIEEISSYWRFAFAAPDLQERAIQGFRFQKAMIMIVEIYIRITALLGLEFVQIFEQLNS